MFKTDFGKVGIMTCYDSWHPAVARLLALKGAEVILFPSAGYYMQLMHARAADNGVVIAATSGSPCGVWDGGGNQADGGSPDATRYAPTSIVAFEKDDGQKMQIVTVDLSQDSPARITGAARCFPPPAAAACAPPARCTWKTKSPARPGDGGTSNDNPVGSVGKGKRLDNNCQGRPDDYLPFFSCKAVGDVLLEAAQSHPKCQILVLCGHTHSGGEISVAENLRVVTGPAEYGKPEIQQIMDVE